MLARSSSLLPPSLPFPFLPREVIRGVGELVTREGAIRLLATHQRAGSLSTFAERLRRLKRRSERKRERERAVEDFRSRVPRSLARLVEEVEDRRIIFREWQSLHRSGERRGQGGEGFLSRSAPRQRAEMAIGIAAMRAETINASRSRDRRSRAITRTDERTRESRPSFASSLG